MENATKALIIAGAVLIAIVLIAVGMKILGSTKGVTDNVDNISDTMSKSMFNSQFEQYEGYQKGSTVRTLFSKLVANNANNERKVQFQYRVKSGNGNGTWVSPSNPNYLVNVDTMALLLTNNANCNFLVKPIINDEGYIYLITVINQDK